MDGPKTSGSAGKLGTTFARTFPLIRSAVAEVLRLAVEAEQGGMKRLRLDSIRKNSVLGSIYVEAMPRYGRGAGLLAHGNLPTQFGMVASQEDPLLENIGTQWLMHYFLSAARGPGPAYWHEVIVSLFVGGDVVGRDVIVERVTKAHESSEGQAIKKAHASEAATALLSTYVRTDALGGLGVLHQNGDQYHILDPVTAPIWAVAYALLDFWEAQFGDQLTASLNEFYGEKGLTSIFMMSRGRLNTMLETLQSEGMLELHRIAAPYQVVLLQRDREAILRRLYGLGHAQ